MDRYTAALSGATKYTGVPCKHGHVLRFVANSTCVECNRQRHIKKRQEKKSEVNWFNGKPCRVCKRTVRYSANKSCVACTELRNSKRGTGNDVDEAGKSNKLMTDFLSGKYDRRTK